MNKSRVSWPLEGQQLLFSFMSEIPKCDPPPKSTDDLRGTHEPKDDNPPRGRSEIQLELFDECKIDHLSTPYLAPLR